MRKLLVTGGAGFIGAHKIMSELGYAPQESFEMGIRKTIDWFLANEPWWRAVMDGSYQD